MSEERVIGPNGAPLVSIGGAVPGREQPIDPASEHQVTPCTERDLAPRPGGPAWPM